MERKLCSVSNLPIYLFPPSLAFTFSLAKIWGEGGVEEKLGWHRGTQIRLWMWSCQNGIIYFSQNDSTTDEDDDGDDDDDEEVVTILPEDKYRMGSLEKMISVMALLVEESRGERYAWF